MSHSLYRSISIFKGNRYVYTWRRNDNRFLAGDFESQCINVTMTHSVYIDLESLSINVTILKMRW